MDVSKMALLFAMAGTPEAPGGGPSAAPSGMSFTAWGGPDKWRVHWVNGDATAFTRVYWGAVGSAFGSATLLEPSANPGAAFYDTPLESGNWWEEEPANRTDYRFFLTHYKNGVESAVVFLDTNA